MNISSDNPYKPDLFDTNERIPGINLPDVILRHEFIPEKDIPAMHSWFLDAAHCTPPVTPLFGWLWAEYCTHGFKTACKELSVPGCRGWEIRLLQGNIYFSLNIIRDHREIARREINFDKSLKPWIADFDGLWNRHKIELLSLYNKLKKFDIDRFTDAELSRHHTDLKEMYKRMWEIHFLGMYASFSAWYLFEKITLEDYGLKDSDPEFQDMMRGFDNRIYQMDNKLREFKQRAVEMGIDYIFRDNGPDRVTGELMQTERGRHWLAEFMSYLHNDEVGGWRMTRFSDLTEPYWLEKPAIPIALIRDSIVNDIQFDLVNIRREMAEKREKAISRFLKTVNPEKMEYIAGILKLAGNVSSYNEEHDLYCELMAHSLLRRGYLAIGRRLAKAGAISKPEDILMLSPEEIDDVMKSPESYDLHCVTDNRRSDWEYSCRCEKPPVIFTDRQDFAEALKLDIIPSRDAIAIKAMVALQKTVSDPAADLHGICGCAGKVTGKARVVNTYEELAKIKTGEILVCPAANPAWTPAFGKISGIICDNGGVLCHAAIIGREFGLPTIVNTQNGTVRIKSGQTLMIDAEKGAVYFLD